MEKNILYVSKGYDPETAYQSDFKVHGFHFVTWNGESGGENLLPADVTFKIRHTPEYFKARIEKTSEDSFMVHSDAPIHGVAPGQFCVIYDENHHRCFGSGEITL